jgi:hypothetical protein
MKAALSQKTAMTFRHNPIMKAALSQKTAMALRHTPIMKAALSQKNSHDTPATPPPKATISQKTIPHPFSVSLRMRNTRLCRQRMAVSVYACYE